MKGVRSLYLVAGVTMAGVGSVFALEGIRQSGKSGLFPLGHHVGMHAVLHIGVTGFADADDHAIA